MMNKRNQSKLVALGGICSALSVVLLLISSIIPLATYIAPMLAGIALVPLKEEMGTKSAFTAYIACSFLSILLVPEKECVMMFVFLLGWYPIVKEYVDKTKGRLLRILEKLAIFNVSIISGYFVLIKLFSMDYILEEFGGMVLILTTLALGNVAFIVYDIALAVFRKVYYFKVRKMFGLK